MYKMELKSIFKKIDVANYIQVKVFTTISLLVVLSRSGLVQPPALSTGIYMVEICILIQHSLLFFSFFSLQCKFGILYFGKRRKEIHFQIKNNQIIFSFFFSFRVQSQSHLGSLVICLEHLKKRGAFLQCLGLWDLKVPGSSPSVEHWLWYSIF